MSVQTDSRSQIEQYTQVIINLSTDWTQCTVSQTDQSVQAICKQSPATVQVAPEMSDASIQTSAVVAEPPQRLFGAVDLSDITGHHAEEAPCVMGSDKNGKVVDFSLAAQPEIESIEESPSHSACPSPAEQLQDDQSTRTPATAANVVSVKCNEEPAQFAAISTLTEQLPSHVRIVPAIIQKQFPAPTVSATLQPSLTMSTATKYVYSVEQQTFLASSLMVQQSSETGSLCYSGSHTASVQNVPIQQLVRETPLQTFVSQALSAKSFYEVCTTHPIVTSSEMSSSHTTVSDTLSVVKPLISTSDNMGEVCISSDCISKLSTNLQQSVSSVDNSSSELETAKEKEMTTKKPSACAERNELVLNASLHVTKGIEYPSVNKSCQLTEYLENSVVNESAAYDITKQTSDAKDTKFSQVVLLEDDCGKFGSHRQNEKVLECENMRDKQCEKAMPVQRQSTYTCGEKSSISSTDVSATCASNRHTNEHRSSIKEQKATVTIEVDSNLASVTRGRRRPLFVSRGPLMETAATPDSMSSHCKLYKRLELDSRKLPAMLLGML